MKKLLIVDDSALMRRHITQIFKAESDFIIKSARNGREAIDMNREFQPDVITLDINMPEMDGLSALSLIMAERPVPVVMLSSLTAAGALATFEALNLGAVDFVTKPDGSISLSIENIKKDLVEKINSAIKSQPRTRSNSLPQEKAAIPKTRTQRVKKTDDITPNVSTQISRPVSDKDKIVIIGVSTGGPKTLEEILPKLPSTLAAPIVVAQHMPASFTASLAERLNRSCGLTVSELSKMTPLKSGNVYIARGNADIHLVSRNGQLCAHIKPEDKSHLWHPSVELLGRSALSTCRPNSVMAIMLTGMGSDGSDAFSELHRRGATTIAESSETAIVFGMPAELIDKRGAGTILPAHAIAHQISKWAGA